MRGKNKLVLHIAVVSVTGMLALTATFPQPEIIQTEGIFQPIEYGTAGVMTAMLPDEQLNGVLKQTLTDEKNSTTTATVSSKEKESENKAADENVSAGDKEEDKKETSKEISKETLIKDSKKSAKKSAKEEKADSEIKEKTVKEKQDNKKNTSDKKESKKLSAVEKKWAERLMADVDDYLNVRKSADVDSEVIGKLRRGDAATVIKAGKTWTKIKSGSVTGYVKNKYCVFGAKAYKLANKICETYATVQADGLRIRKYANKNSLVLDAAEEHDKLVVNTKKKAKDGWVSVKYDDRNAYVSEEYVKVALDVGKAITIEEEQAQIEAERRAEQEAAETALANMPSDSTDISTEVSQNNAVLVSDDDLTLLSAIIYCEAGGESYAGQVAVGAVVMNRVRSGSYPNTISGVVYQSGQFSPVANGSLARALSNGSYQNCTSAAREALAGADNTGGAHNFHRVNGDAGLVIGHHVFF